MKIVLLGHFMYGHNRWGYPTQMLELHGLLTERQKGAKRSSGTLGANTNAPQETHPHKDVWCLVLRRLAGVNRNFVDMLSLGKAQGCSTCQAPLASGVMK